MENPDSSSNESMLIDNVDCKITEFCERTFEEDEQEQNPGIVRRHYSWNKRLGRDNTVACLYVAVLQGNGHRESV